MTLRGKQARIEWWEGLPAGIREQIDGYVLQDARDKAAQIVVDIGLVPDDIGVGVARLVVSDRYEALDDRIAYTPDNPIDLESLTRRAAGAGGRILAIEALWCMRTRYEWIVRLFAITDGEGSDVFEWPLAIIRRRTGERYMGRQLPVSAAAEETGRALAERLGVPFHFPNRDAPNDEAPRWSPTSSV